MSRRKKFLLLVWFVSHFLLILIVSCHETIVLVARGLTIIPPALGDYPKKAEKLAEIPIGLNLGHSNLLRRVVVSYLGAAGIDAGYGYFAPNVPGGYRLVFELQFPDGRTEFLMASAAANLRLASFVDQIGDNPSAEFREHMVKKLAAVVRAEHPEVVTVRASLERISQPTISDYERGGKEKYELLDAYEF